MIRNSPLLLWLGSASAVLLPLLLTVARNFEYEYLTLVAWLHFLLLPSLALIAKPLRSSRTTVWLAASLGSLAFSLLPAGLAFSSGLCPCSQKDFLFWWFIQALPHMILGQALFFAVLKLKEHNWNSAWCLALLLSLFLSLFSHFVWQLWFFPQKRITHLLAGFVHGAIYDNWIPIDPGVLWARGGHLCLAFGALILFLPIFKNILARIGSGIFFAAFVYCSLHSREFPSQKHGLPALMEQMPEVIGGQGFRLHYRKPAQAEQQKIIDETANAVAFHIRDLNQTLMSYETDVHVFLYPSRTSKKLWFGGDTTDVTDVVTPSIHILQDEGWPNSTLRHELVHALSSRFAFHGLGFHPNLAFTEGLAVALAPQDDELSIDEGAARLLESDRAPEMQQLFSPLFWGQAGYRAYTLAGSFVKFLMRRYGMPLVKLLYAGMEWDHVFPVEADIAIAMWKKELEVTYPPSKESITAESLSRYPGILYDRCPHSKALLALDEKDWFVDLRQPSGWNRKTSYWPWVLSFDHDPRYQLASLRQGVDGLWKDFHETKARELLEKLETLGKPKPEVLEDVSFTLLKLDLMSALGEWDKVKDEMEQYVQVLKLYKLSPALERQVWSRSTLLHEDLSQSKDWLDLLAGRRHDLPPKPQLSEPWIHHYLYMRNHTFTAAAVPELETFRALQVPSEAPPSFVVEWHLSLGQHWRQLGHWKEAAEAFSKAANAASSGRRELIELYAKEAQSHVTTFH